MESSVQSLKCEGIGSGVEVVCKYMKNGPEW